MWQRKWSIMPLDIRQKVEFKELSMKVTLASKQHENV